MGIYYSPLHDPGFNNVQIRMEKQTASYRRIGMGAYTYQQAQTTYYILKPSWCAKKFATYFMLHFGK